VTIRDELAARVLSLLTEIAPDVDPDTVIPGVDFRDQFDFDSMDTLNFAIALHRELGVDVPEAEYSQLASLDKCLAYLRSRGDERHSPVSAPRK
jgi:acyl carrier protein